MLRDEVLALSKSGPLPGESEATEEQLKSYEILLLRIEKPITEEEARSLVPLFGEDNCYGLAWTLLHLIESAPHWPLWDALTDTQNEWVARLRCRAERTTVPVQHITFPEAVLRHPKMYTTGGTFNECIAFLVGYYSGLAKGDVHAPPARIWSSFLEWLMERINPTYSGMTFVEFRSKHPEDPEAFEEMLRLLDLYQKERGERFF